AIFIGRGWVSREEFWRLPPGEIWWIMDAHLPPEKFDETPAAQKERLYQRLKAAIAEAEEKDT
ncbi:MAG: hypothetical protein AAF982_01965, partial [Pseudomonadota bacterium]